MEKNENVWYKFVTNVIIKNMVNYNVVDVGNTELSWPCFQTSQPTT